VKRLLVTGPAAPLLIAGGLQNKPSDAAGGAVGKTLKKLFGK